MRIAATFVAVVVSASLLSVAHGEDPPAPMNKTFVNDKGQLDGKLVYTMVQLGGFVGSLGSSVVIEPDGTWSGARAIGGRKTELKGKLSAEQIKTLGKALAEHDLAGLPKVIGSAKPVASPRIIADGASTTVKLKIGDHEVISNSADGVDAKEEEVALRTRLTLIGNAIQDATLNAAAEK